MDDRELLIRYRDGDLLDEELARLEERLKIEPGLRSRLENLEEIATLLERGAAGSFEHFKSHHVCLRKRQEIQRVIGQHFLQFRYRVLSFLWVEYQVPASANGEEIVESHDVLQRFQVLVDVEPMSQVADICGVYLLIRFQKLLAESYDRLSGQAAVTADPKDAAGP